MTTDPRFTIGENEEDTVKSIHTMFNDNQRFFIIRGVDSKEKLVDALKFQFIMEHKHTISPKVRLSKGFVIDFISKRISGYSVTGREDDIVGNFVGATSGEGLAFLYGISTYNIDATNHIKINECMQRVLNELRKIGYAESLSTSHTDVVVSFLSSPLHRNLFFLYVKAMTKIDTKKTFREISSDSSAKQKLFMTIATDFFNNLTSEKHTPVTVWSCNFNTTMHSSGAYVLYNECSPVTSSRPVVIRNPVSGIIIMHSNDKYFSDESMLGEVEDHRKILDAITKQQPPKINNERLVPIHVPVTNMTPSIVNKVKTPEFLTKFQESSFVYSEVEPDEGFFDNFGGIISSLETADDIASSLFEGQRFDTPLIPISNIFPVIQPEVKRMTVEECITVAERTKSSVIRINKENMDKAGFMLKIISENGYGFDSITFDKTKNMTIIPVSNLLNKNQQ